jgi:hypothetical protein
VSDGYKSKNYALRGAAKSVGASETATVVSDVFPISSRDSLDILIKIKCSAVTSTTGITAKLQESWNGGSDWEAVGNRAQATVTGNGTVEISLIHTDTSDAAQLPLWPLGRIVVDSGADDAVTVDEVWVSRRV